jgi:alkaline phosphatase D
MKRSFSRRTALKAIGIGTAAISLPNPPSSSAAEAAGKATSKSDWHTLPDRVWLGADYWANPMEDWRIVKGAAECSSLKGDRNIQLLTHQLTNLKGKLEMSVRISQVEMKGKDGGAGFRLGNRSDINEYRSNSFSRAQLNAGLRAGKLFIGRKEIAISGAAKPKGVTLRLTGKPAGAKYSLTLTAANAAGKELGSVTQVATETMLLGNVALGNNSGPDGRARGKAKGKASGGAGSARYRFENWTASGDAFTVTPEHSFGPILWSQYSLSDSRGKDGYVMKISALTGPLGEKDNQDIELQVNKGGGWRKVGTAALDTDAWTATFRVANWNEKKETPFKLIFRQKHTDSSETKHERTGKIKANPVGRPLRVGALTCQKDYAFPYEPVANNLLKLDPDMLYFSGDQLYENHGGYGLIRDPAGPAILNYLRKFYMHGWSFGEAMRDRPTICIPDDHDVFQGNYWGEGGAKMQNLEGGASSKGGYREPVRMVNVVHKTCTAHHPDFANPKPVKQNMSVYYGDMVYGGVSFAIISDRQFKSGPEKVETGSGRADHVKDMHVDTLHLDKPGLVLLGERQEKFLEQWGEDWRAHNMKVLLSQTVFSGVATHHGGYGGYLKADLDSGGWPQTARNRTVRILQKAKSLHINGDQHLTTLSQYGADKQRDGSWSFCTPAIAAGYPRWWRPDEIGMKHKNRPKHGLPNTGEFIEGFGNKAYVYAVGNPEVGKKKNRYELAHQKASGFGLVTIDTKKKTYLIESFKFSIDPTDGKASNQYPGWPVTIQQKENGGDNVIG